jgi:hypothetical protein
MPPHSNFVTVVEGPDEKSLTCCMMKFKNRFVLAE